VLGRGKKRKKRSIARRPHSECLVVRAWGSARRRYRICGTPVVLVSFSNSDSRGALDFLQRMKHCGNLPQIPSLAAFGGRHRNFWFFMSEMECLRGSSRVHPVVQVYSVRRGLIMHIPEKRESTRVAME
jgi:hypothetical protein